MKYPCVKLVIKIISCLELTPYISIYKIAIWVLRP